MKLCALKDLLIYVYLQLVASIKRGEEKARIDFPSFLTLVKKELEKEAYVVGTRQE